LLLLKKAGFLSIKSQPSVNGNPSDAAVFGWGGSGGFVYQKQLHSVLLFARTVWTAS
jgi:methylenetetrahydrofolate reductase (NADPH)